MEPNHHHHQPHKPIGGSKGTRYGCCPHSRKARADKKGSNCHHHHKSPHHH